MATLLDTKEEAPHVGGSTRLVEQRATASETEMVPAPAGADVVLMFERLASNPDVPVEKLERLMAMQERIIDRNAKADFDAAYAAMQGEIPVIDEKGKIIVEGVIRSRYATNEDIQEICKPILREHGFALRFRSEIADGRIKVTGTLSHRSGHSESDEFVTLPDKTGSKNDIQAIGSARAYGQRYTTIALLNIATRGTDDDGKAAGKLTEPPSPAGYDAWFATLDGVADGGMADFAPAWNKSPKEFTTYLARTAPKMLAALKNKAAKVKP